MATEKLIQNSVDENGNHQFSTGLGFVRALNSNAETLGTETKLDLETHNTPEALLKAMKEQSKNKVSYKTPGGPDDLSMGEEASELKGGIGQIYNSAVEDTPSAPPTPIKPPSVPDDVDSGEGDEIVPPTEPPLDSDPEVPGGTEPGESTDEPTDTDTTPAANSEDNFVIDEEEQ